MVWGLRIQFRVLGFRVEGDSGATCAELAGVDCHAKFEAVSASGLSNLASPKPETVNSK